MTDVFISYSRSDEAVAQRLATELEKENLSVWHWTRDIIHSIPHPEQTFARIDESRCFLCIVSKQALSTDFIFPEILRASSQHKSFVTVLRGLTYKELEREKPRWCQAFGFSPAVEWHDQQEEIAVRKIIRAILQIGQGAIPSISLFLLGVYLLQYVARNPDSPERHQLLFLISELDGLPFNWLDVIKAEKDKGNHALNRIVNGLSLEEGSEVHHLVMLGLCHTSLTDVIDRVPIGSLDRSFNQYNEHLDSLGAPEDLRITPSDTMTEGEMTKHVERLFPWLKERN